MIFQINLDNLEAQKTVDDGEKRLDVHGTASKEHWQAIPKADSETALLIG
jgi:hypothetical protein